MDIIQFTAQDKLKTPTQVKQDSLISHNSFEKTLKDQEKLENTPDTSSIKSAEIKELPIKERKSSSADQNMEKETAESLNTSEFESKIPQNNNTDDLLDIRNDMANILPFASAVIEIQNPDQSPENKPNDLSFDRIFSYALNLDQDNGQKLVLDQDQLKDLGLQGLDLENDVLSEIPVDVLNPEQDFVSKASNANEMSVDHIIQSSNINLKPTKLLNVQAIKSSEANISLEDEDSKDNLLEKQVSSATIPSKNADIMSKIFESSSFIAE
ncbi:MAG: hypothetical protein ACRYGR_00775 [Janthinobacterium lividum]